MTSSKIKDIVDEENKFIDYILDIIQRKGITFVGINCCYGNIPRVRKIVTSIVEHYPNLLIALGGAFVNSLCFIPNGFEMLFEYMPSLDCVFWGDGELSFFNYIRYRGSDKHWMHKPGIITKSNCQITRNRSYDLRNIDLYPFPTWNSFDKEEYINIRYIIASRGCLYNCTFCDERAIWHDKYRFRNMYNIISEIEYNISDYSINSFQFRDSSFTSYTDLRRLCEHIVSNNLNIKYYCLARVNEIISNPEILGLLVDSGCKTIEYGMETSNDNILRYINKGILSQDVQKAVKLTKEYDIKIQGSFIIGLPTEPCESICNTIDFAMNLDLDIYRWHIFQPSIKELIKSHVSPERIFEAYISFSVPNMNLFSLYETKTLERMLFFEQHFLSSLPEDVIRRIGNTKLFDSRLTIKDAYYLINKANEMTPGRFTEDNMSHLLQ
ncbi:MAG: B12-binding domain-containing radical SAM protein [Theionarchaea archaeon]|nr:B12-binding domain-containing radical SAM protein [Theionarchaea archaeon]